MTRVSFIADRQGGFEVASPADQPNCIAHYVTCLSNTTRCSAQITPVTYLLDARSNNQVHLHNWSQIASRDRSCVTRRGWTSSRLQPG